jgi:hypothetical protein
VEEQPLRTTADSTAAATAVLLRFIANPFFCEW